MRPEILPLLRCPLSGASFRLEAARVEGGHVMEGALHAEAAPFSYPITGGIPRLLTSKAKGRRTRSAFNLQWARRELGLEAEGTLYGHSLDDATEFIARTVLPRPGAGQALVLDAGCGTGERSAALARRGHRVLAFDLSDSVNAAFRRFRDLPGLHLLQADVLHPPVALRSVQTLVCIGVLHHTPRPRDGFAALARLQRRGGKALIWIYPRERSKVDPFLGKLYRLRDALRVAHRLPPRGVWGVSVALSAVLYPFYAGRFNLLRKDARPKARETWGAILMNTYDFLAPPYQSRHTPEEVERWFREEGYASPERAGTGFFYATLKRDPSRLSLLPCPAPAAG